MNCELCNKKALGYCDIHPVCVNCSKLSHQGDKIGTYYWLCNSCNSSNCSSCEKPEVITDKFDFCRKPECVDFSNKIKRGVYI